MLVSAAYKVILLDREEARQLAMRAKRLPPMRRVDLNDTPYVAIPHRLGEARIVRSAGLRVPSPIETQYSWPKPPHVIKEQPHQVDTAGFLTFYPRAFVLNEIGTMKTLSAYWAVDYLMRLGEVRRALVISPKSSLKLTHGNTLFQTFTDRSFAIVTGDAKRRRNLVKHPFDYYIINPEGVAVVYDELRARTDIDLVLIDECAEYQLATNDKWKVLNSLINDPARPYARYVWGMTGRPTPNAPTDAYGQVRLIHPEMLTRYGYRSFRQFKEATMVKVSMFRWRPRERKMGDNVDAVDIVARIMQPSIRYGRDVVKLNQPVILERECELTPAQKKAYNSMLQTLVAEVNGGTVTAANEAVKIMRLIQTVTGTVYDVDGKHQHIDCQPRLDVAVEMIKQAEGKTILFVPFTGNLFWLVKLLEKEGFTVGQVYGGTPQHERDRVLHDFQESEHPQLLVAHPACMAHSLTLTAANLTIWWGPYNSNRIYTQANGRTDRMGQTRQTFIGQISATTIERKVFKRLDKQQKLEGTLLELMEELR